MYLSVLHTGSAECGLQLFMTVKIDAHSYKAFREKIRGDR